MTYLPTLKQLQYLTALHQHGHFGRAAEAVRVTQSTLSAGLRELETLLGTVLVERTQRVVRFTPLGERIVAKAYGVLREADELAAMASAGGKPLSGELRLGVIPTIAPFLLPRLLPGLRETFPDLKLYLREDLTATGCESLSRGQLDCLLLALPYPCGDVTSKILFRDPFYLAFHPAEFDGRAPYVLPEAIDEHRLLMLEDGHCLRGHALEACGRPELRTDSAHVGTSLHTLVQMVANRLGLTLLPEMAVVSGILNGTPVQARPVDGPHASREIALAWRASSPRSDEFMMLAASLQEAWECQMRTEWGREGSEF
jgi:LysR family hydrogen peroxide-inducible transcriptional activator